MIAATVLAYARFAAVALIGAGLAFCAWKVNSWRVEAREKQVLSDLLDEERRARELRAQAAAKTERVSTAAETEIASSHVAAERVRIIYREAKREDPDCAAWAAAAVACPLGEWLPADARDPPRRVPRDTGEPASRLWHVSRSGCQTEHERRTGGGVARLQGVREGVPHQDRGDTRACYVSG